MIGFDIQNVKRIKDEEQLMHKIALESEIAYIEGFGCNKKERVASLWAVKEAVFKALDIKNGDISFKEIELCHKDSGAPFIKLYGKALCFFEKLEAKKIEVSLSHQCDIVGAVVVVS